jgi:hypothetical protein
LNISGRIIRSVLFNKGDIRTLRFSKFRDLSSQTISGWITETFIENKGCPFRFSFAPCPLKGVLYVPESKKVPFRGFRGFLKELIIF